jgi:ABC-type glutathione transport system ATPase component
MELFLLLPLLLPHPYTPSVVCVASLPPRLHPTQPRYHRGNREGEAGPRSGSTNSVPAMDLLSGKLLRSVRLHSPSLPSTSLPSRRLCRRRLAPLHCRLTTSTTTTTTTDEEAEDAKSQDFSSLFSSDAAASSGGKKKRSNSGASSIPSGVRLENVSKSYKGVTVLKDVSWEVQRGEKAGLVGVNGAGKTTQLRIIAGLEDPDAGTVVKAKDNMKVAFLSQEFQVSASRTVREEFFSAFQEEMEVKRRLDRVQAALEAATEDMDLMARLLDELDLLQRRSQDVDLDMVGVKVQKLMPDLGFLPEDADRLVASFSGGWKMRMSLGKILLQVYI